MNIRDFTAPVYIEVKGHRGFIVLNRPEKRNALNEAMWHAIPNAVEALMVEKAVRVIILCSSTPGMFAAGADIAELEIIAGDEGRSERNRLAIRAAQGALAASLKPTIAMIDGPCIGGACGLAVHCDFRYASEISCFAITPAKLGLVYPLRDMKRLLELVGPSYAKKMLFTGKQFTSADAMSMGLVDSCFSSHELQDGVDAFAHELAEVSQYSLQHLKSFFVRLEKGQRDDCRDTAALFRESKRQQDAKEGIAAFLAKRKPRFCWPE